jgi:hypothetical protein
MPPTEGVCLRAAEDSTQASLRLLPTHSRDVRASAHRFSEQWRTDLLGCPSVSAKRVAVRVLGRLTGRYGGL